MIRQLRDGLYTACGLLAVLLAAAGFVLPLLPTTPFLLLAAVCFYRGSPRLHRWIEQHPWTGPSLRLWRRHRAISPVVRRNALIYLWASLLGTVLLALDQAVPRLLLLLLGTVISAHLLRLDTMVVETERIGKSRERENGARERT